MSSMVLERPTLVLNRNWQPVGVASVARSLVMVWNETARVVDPDDYQLYGWLDWSKLVPRTANSMCRRFTAAFACRKSSRSRVTTECRPAR